MCIYCGISWLCSSDSSASNALEWKFLLELGDVRSRENPVIIQETLDVMESVFLPEVVQDFKKGLQELFPNIFGRIVDAIGDLSSSNVTEVCNFLEESLCYLSGLTGIMTLSEMFIGECLPFQTNNVVPTS